LARRVTDLEVPRFFCVISTLLVDVVNAVAELTL
jgi:hypothetical protein